MTNPFQVDEDTLEGTVIAYTTCPSCDKVVIFIKRGPIGVADGEFVTMESKMVYPSKANIFDSEDIPEDYINDYEESIRVLGASAKASAALNRRILQRLLREEYNIKGSSLSDEINKFIELPGLPSYITDAVDAVRNIGNFAAHPIKDERTGEIVPVETGEAEWLKEVIESLFDFTFIQPKKLMKRKMQLNMKLENAGKPPMKDKK